LSDGVNSFHYFLCFKSGGTFDASFWRIIGTLIGALVGWIALEAGNGSPYFLALFAIFLGNSTIFVIMNIISVMSLLINTSFSYTNKKLFHSSIYI
jgi:F0F1-type ATP synthase assembly protein I